MGVGPPGRRRSILIRVVGVCGAQDPRPSSLPVPSSVPCLCVPCRPPVSPPWPSGGAPCSHAAQRTPKDTVRGQSPCRRPHPGTVPTVPASCLPGPEASALASQGGPAHWSPTLVELRVGSMDRVGSPDPQRPLLGPWREPLQAPPPRVSSSGGWLRRGARTVFPCLAQCELYHGLALTVQGMRFLMITGAQRSLLNKRFKP